MQSNLGEQMTTRCSDSRRSCWRRDARKIRKAPSGSGRPCKPCAAKGRGGHGLGSEPVCWSRVRFVQPRSPKPKGMGRDGEGRSGTGRDGKGRTGSGGDGGREEVSGVDRNPRERREGAERNLRQEKTESQMRTVIRGTGLLGGRRNKLHCRLT